jgi:hypothetical protein
VDVTRVCYYLWRKEKGNNKGKKSRIRFYSMNDLLKWI